MEVNVAFDDNRYYQSMITQMTRYTTAVPVC